MEPIPTIRVTHRGTLPIGDGIDCGVTSDGRRILSMRGFAAALGQTGNPKPSDGASKWPSFLTGKAMEPYLRDVLTVTPNQPFWVVVPHFIDGKHVRDNRVLAVRAEIIPDICWAYVDAEAAGALHHKQKHLAQHARDILRKLGHRAMRDMVDQASGYAETPPAPEPGSTFVLPATYAEALRALADQVERNEAQERRLAVAEPRAVAWTVLASTDRDYDVGTVAKILNRDPAIQTGRGRLFRWLVDHGMAYRETEGNREVYKPYQQHVDTGRLVMRLGGTYPHPKTGEIKSGSAQLRITTKGVGYIHRAMGGTADLDLR